PNYTAFMKKCRCIKMCCLTIINERSSVILARIFIWKNKFGDKILNTETSKKENDKNSRIVNNAKRLSNRNKAKSTLSNGVATTGHHRQP
ncbi:hypothetical protein, partial [Rodentibacter caecimuris]|uniref:hypothetical protein n=1 Tax=Rodentibacter caecimuris TaxID=1796644 RepID=UPI00258C1020